MEKPAEKEDSTNYRCSRGRKEQSQNLKKKRTETERKDRVRMNVYPNGPVSFFSIALSTDKLKDYTALCDQN